MPGIGAECYVQTADIRQAVRGRETDILDNLGIPWRDGRQHIRCPYPDHPDRNPSWRWASRRSRAVCTCTASASIIDVVMKVKSVDLGAAKLWIAEVLGREDLIRPTSCGQQRQRHDAASLLDALDDNRDDELPFVYLAERLGIDPAAVPRPTTPVAGIRALEYFELSATRRAKPQLVGSWPCAVLGTIAADGRSHAHRIYLARNGRGKADLGEVRPGKRRDPKKSAKLADGQPSPAGCAVVWGDPKRAPHVVLAEGIETAAAVAYALRDQIENDHTVVSSAVTAGGIEAFVP